MLWCVSGKFMSVVAWLYYLLEFSSALSAELQLRTMDGVAQTTLTNGAWNLWQGLHAPILVDWHHIDDCVGKKKDKSQNGGDVSPMPQTWTYKQMKHPNIVIK